jgi:aspartyl/asparaginyl beta-hydroxylase (cupin superfamily)
MDTTFICIGVIVVFLITYVVFINFILKSTNYYKPETFPILKYISKNNQNIFINEFNKIENDPNWVNWPDSENISGDCKIFPIYMFGTISKDRKAKCLKLYNLIHNIPNVKSCAYIKIGQNSKLCKQRQWKDLANSTLRCLFILKSVASAPIETCGICVNNESKKILSNNLVVFDSSKEHSIYNNTDYPVYALMVDIKRPVNIPDGTSDREYSIELYNFVCDLNKQ